MRDATWGLKGWMAGLMAMCLASVASAQVTPGDPGWFVRVIDVDVPITNLEQHNNVLGMGNVVGISDSVSEVIDYNGGPFEVNNAWPLADMGDGFVARAIAEVTIPAGDWAVGWGSDDGGQMTIPGVEFVTSFENDRDWPLPEGRTDQLVFDGNRGYRPSYGSFSLDEPLTTTINVSMWENTGDDSFEVFYLDLEQYGIEADELTADAADRPTPDNEWSLLGDPDSFSASWNVRVPQTIPPVAIPVSPGQMLSGAAQDVTKEVIGGIQPGLLHHWYGRNNPGSLENAAAFYDLNDGAVEPPDFPPFNPENTWWTGNQDALVGGTTEAPKYPEEVIGKSRLDGGTFNGNDNNNYTVGLSGELRFPRDGEYMFTDGIDDLTVFAVDLDRDGEFTEDEILINDNDWTNLQRDAANGGFPGEYIPIDIDVPEDGNCDDAANASDLCWYQVEMIVGEGGGTDAGIIYWNENEDIEFPAPNGDGRVIAFEDIPELAIPEDHMRAPGGEKITSAKLVATLNDEFPYEFEINEDGTFDSVEVERSIDVATTTLDLNGATINLVANGDLSGLTGEVKLLSADTISGELGDIIVPDGVTVDTSRLATEGVLVFGEVAACNANSGGDLNGDGEVGFPDFLILSANFGTTTDGTNHATGDINCDGAIGFPDFLVLSANFGNTVGEASSVPEPSGLALLGCASLMMGMLRRRR